MTPGSDVSFVQSFFCRCYVRRVLLPRRCLCEGLFVVSCHRDIAFVREEGLSSRFAIVGRGCPSRLAVGHYLVGRVVRCV